MLRQRITLPCLGLILTVSLAACGRAGSEPSPQLPTPVPNIPTAVPTAVPTVNFTNQNWGAASPDPLKYRGSPVLLTGQVFNVEDNDARVGIQMWTDPLRGEGNTVVVFPKQGFPTIGKGDQVEVQGTLVGDFTGKNDAGEPLRLPRVEASSIKVLTKASAASSAAPSPSTSAAATGAVGAATSVPPATITAAARLTAVPTATPPTIALGVYQVQGSEPTGLSVRTGPAISQNKLGVVHDGGLIQVVAPAAPGWAQVKGDGFTGFVSRLYLTGPIAGNQSLAKLAPR